ncbi:MAG TPA: DUF3027 domain-containing protein [Microbacteriaceae bacterium]
MPELNPFAIPESPPTVDAPVAELAEAPTTDEPVAELVEASTTDEPVAELVEAPTTDEPAEPAVLAVPAVADDVLLASVELAREALLEITPSSTIGAPAGHIVEGHHVLSLLFECTMSGYPGWYWTVSMARTGDEAAPSVLETELMPGDTALLAPDWVPWSERLAEYQATQEAARAGEVAEATELDDGADDLDDEDDLDDDDDVDDDDVDDIDEGDLDGVDIDSLHEAIEDDDDEDDGDGEEFEAADITGVELATLELEDDEPENSEGASDDGGPGQPAGAAGEHGADED